MSSKKAEARERVKAMREEQANKERKRERMLRFGIAGTVLAGVVIIAVAINATRGGGTSDLPSDLAVNLPSELSEEEVGIVMGDPDAPVRIDSWFDFLCPHCQEFEDVNSDTMDELIESGDVQVVYHPLTFTGANLSVSANNAFACSVADDKANEFLRAAFFVQIESTNPVQWTNEDLIEIGDHVGTGDDFAACVEGGTNNDWVDSVGNAAAANNVTGTPTLFIDGPGTGGRQVMDARTPDDIREAVQAAAG
jgi:protein-disulfide isomerase